MIGKHSLSSLAVKFLCLALHGIVYPTPSVGSHFLIYLFIHFFIYFLRHFLLLLTMQITERSEISS